MEIVGLVAVLLLVVGALGPRLFEGLMTALMSSRPNPDETEE
jgi:hypothetical protein